MKHIYIFIIIVCIHITSLFGQEEINWMEIYGGTEWDFSNDLLQTLDSGYIFIGFTHSNDIDVSGNHGGRDIWVVKLNNQREIEWQKCIGGTDWESGAEIFYLNDTTYMVVASTKSNDGDIIENHGNYDGLLMKLDLDGNILWQSSYGGEQSDHFYNVCLTNDGGYIVVGNSSSDYINGTATGNHGSTDVWIVKLDSLGIIEWYKIYGGYHEDVMSNIMEANDGGYIVAGTTWSNDGDVTGFKGGTDCWILKLDEAGNIEWKRCYGGSGIDHTTSLIKSGNDGYLVGAYSNSIDGDITNNIGSNDLWLFEIDNLGNIIWQKCYGGTLSDQPTEIGFTINGNIIVAGNTWSNDGDVSGLHGQVDMWILEIDSLHDIIWQKCVGGYADDRSRDLIETDENVYIIIGVTNSEEGDIPFNYGHKDICFYELESNIIGAVSSISGNDSICEGTQSETYSIEPILNAGSYTWTLDPDIADSIITNDTVATIYFIQDTIGYATLSVFGSNSGGNSDTAYLGINILAQATSNAGEDDTLCVGYPYFLSGTSQNDSSIIWNTLGDGIIENPEQLTTYYYPGSEDITNGVVVLTLTAFSFHPCNENITDSITLIVDSIPNQPLKPSGPQIIILDTCTNSLYITDSVENATYYQWFIHPDDAGEIVGNGVESLVYWNITYTGLSAYISVESVNQCGGTLSDSLVVDIFPVNIKQNSFVPEILISPNPSNGVFSIDISSLHENVDIHIADLKGNIIKQKKIFQPSTGSTIIMDLSNEKSGIYYITFVFEQNKTIGYKLIKR